MTFYLFNRVISTRPDRTGASVSVPGLVDADCRIVMPLLRYQVYLRMKGFSQSKLQKVREAVRLFAEYSFVNRPKAEFGTGQVGHVRVVSHWEHFRNFRHALVFGTFGTDGFDPSGLYWCAQGSNKSDSVVRLLTEFFTYLDELDGGSRAQQFNPVITPTDYEALCASAAYEYVRNKALLGHTWSRPGEVAHVHRAASGIKATKTATRDVRRIAYDEFARLLLHGFDSTSEVGLRDCLVTVLMNKTGVRCSEALGAWVIDVINDPANLGSAHITLKHPIEAKVRLEYKGRVYARRTDYLKSVYGLADRISLPKRDLQHLGWKSRFDTLQLYWAEPWWGRVFWQLFVAYLKMTATKRAHHPYLFIDSGSGAPLTYDTFAKSYQRAIYRAGLVQVGLGLSLSASGLTPHGNRHAYGNRLKSQYGCSEKVVQNALHHASPESQLIYTVPSSEQTKEEIARAAKRIRKCELELTEMKQSLPQVKAEIHDKFLKDRGQLADELADTLTALARRVG